MGQAAAKDPHKLARFYRESPRFRRLFAMVEWALAFSDGDVLRAYIDTLDPALWRREASHVTEPGFAAERRQVAGFLEHADRHARLARILRLLHGIKIALIQRIFRLATHIPDFSDQHGVTWDELIGNVLHLDIEDSLRRLALIFPKIDDAGAAGDFGEPATYRSDANQSYEQEHARIFQPLAGLHELLRRSSVGIYHTLGALG